MSDDSEAVEIYDHVHVHQIIVHPDGKRCITVSWNQVKMFSLHSHEHLTDFQGAELSIRDAALFDDDTLMAYTSTFSDSDAEIVFWSLSNGAVSLRYEKRKVKYIFERSSVSIVPLCSNQFMVIGNQIKWGGTSGKAIAYMLKKLSPEFPTIDSATLRVLSTSTIPSFQEVCSHKNRFAVTLLDKTVQVWAWESDEFHCIKVLDIGFKASRVAFSDKYFICEDWSGMCIYNSSTMDFIRKLMSPIPAGKMAGMCNENVLIRAHQDEEDSIAVLDIDGEEILWNRSFGVGIEQCHLSVSKEFGAHLIVATSLRIVHRSLPLHIASKLMECDASAVIMLPPLQEALSRSLAGEGSLADYCDSLITFSGCSASFPEWCSAHQLLVIAVRNGDIDESTAHRGNIAHWFENLYLAVKEVDLTSDEDLVVAKRYLCEAKRMGLIEGIEAVLAALYVTAQVREEVRALHRAGILIFEQVMRIEKRLDMLKKSCEQYRKYQRYSHCVSIALQIIPIVGGASAGVISAGADIVEGLSVKDVADYAFGLGSSLAEGEMSSLGDRIFVRAAEVLGPESVAKMKEEELRLVEEAVFACGLSVEELRLLFIERAKENCETDKDEVLELTEDEVECSENPDIIDGDTVVVDDISELEKNNIGCRDDAETCHFVRESIPQVLNSDTIVGETKREKELGYILDQKPSDLKTCKVRKDNIEDMTQIEIATLCAAFVVRFDDSWVDMFVAFRDRIVRIFEEHRLDGAVMVDRQALSASELAEAILDGLKKDGKGTVALGDTGRVRQFFNMIG